MTLTIPIPNNQHHIDKLLDLSKSEVYEEAILEWRYMEHINNHDVEETPDNKRDLGKRCLCNNPMWRDIFVLWNKETDKYLYVAIGCYNKYYKQVLERQSFIHTLNDIICLSFKFKHLKPVTGRYGVTENKGRYSDYIEMKTIYEFSKNILDEFRFKVMSALATNDITININEFMMNCYSYVNSYPELKSEMSIKNFVNAIHHLEEIYKSLSYKIETERYYNGKTLKGKTFMFLRNTEGWRWVLQEQIQRKRQHFLTKNDKEQFEYFHMFLNNDVEWYVINEGEIPEYTPPHLNFVEDDEEL
jgi:hypothetical protein